MADLTAYTYPEGSDEEKLRRLYQLQQETLEAKSVSTGTKTVVRQDPEAIQKAIDILEEKMKRSGRMFAVHSVHARR